jgi:hypothetical protein
MDSKARKNLINALINDDANYIINNIKGDGLNVLNSILRLGWDGFEKMTDEELRLHAIDRGVAIP